MRDIAAFRTQSSLPNAAGGADYTNAPLLILSGFGSSPNLPESALQLMSTTFQQVIPSIDIEKIKLTQCRRTLLVHKQSDDSIEIRHYTISSNKAVSSSTLTALAKNKLPKNVDLGDIDDVADVLSRDGHDTDTEDGSSRSKVKLVEIGPRIRLSLYRIEDGLCGGNVLLHSYQTKTEQEIDELRKKKQSEFNAREKWK
ncbi:hypothetical protein GEMRC1_012798 [Eukaryota sp. GEM-RC1]